MSTSSTTYFVIYSNISRYGMAGLRLQVMWTFGKTIVEAAAWKMNRSGESLKVWLALNGLYMRTAK